MHILGKETRALHVLPAVGVEQGWPIRRESIMLVNVDGYAQNQLAQDLGEVGYVVRAVTGLPEALSCLRKEYPSAIILCGPDSANACVALRQVTAIPILVLLPRPTESEIAETLKAGADDCQSVSISPRETLLRLRALLRRGHPITFVKT
jgi:DNA-binding response OmpR family regulator